jgi:hypothetical protein
VPITPDTKDWTWVVERPCPECGFDAASLNVAGAAAATRETIARWATVLARPDVRTRPAPTVWSPLEYGAHVRDVFLVMHGRLAAMMTDDDPLFANWDQDAAALAGNYAAADPEAVVAALTSAGEAVAALLGIVTSEDAVRPGRRSNGSRFTVESLSQYMVHDVVHHLHDVAG